MRREGKDEVGTTDVFIDIPIKYLSETIVINVPLAIAQTSVPPVDRYPYPPIHSPGSSAIHPYTPYQSLFPPPPLIAWSVAGHSAVVCF